MPPLVAAGQPIGTACHPLLAGAVVTIAGHDHQAAAVGTGVAGAGDVLDSHGSAEAVLRTVTAGLAAGQVEALAAAGITTDLGVRVGNWSLLGGTQGGLVLRHTLDELGVAWADLADLDAAALAADRAGGRRLGRAGADGDRGRRRGPGRSRRGGRDVARGHRGRDLRGGRADRDDGPDRRPAPPAGRDGRLVRQRRRAGRQAAAVRPAGRRRRRRGRHPRRRDARGPRGGRSSVPPTHSPDHRDRRFRAPNPGNVALSRPAAPARRAAAARAGCRRRRGGRPAPRGRAGCASPRGRGPRARSRSG